MNSIAELLTKLEIPNSDQVYFPSDDTYLFLDYIDTEEFTDNFIKKLGSLTSLYSNENYTVLDKGSGTGILGFCLAYKLIEMGIWNRFKKLIIYFIDINPEAVNLSRRFVNINRHLFSESKIGKVMGDFVEFKYVISDLFNNLISKNIFDICIFNPPYLPSEDIITDENKKKIDLSWNGGDSSGNKILLDFFLVISNYVNPSSEIFFLTSSHSKITELLKKIYELGLNAELIQSVNKFFENIMLFRSRLI